MKKLVILLLALLLLPSCAGPAAPQGDPSGTAPTPDTSADDSSTPWSETEPAPPEPAPPELPALDANGRTITVLGYPSTELDARFFCNEFGVEEESGEVLNDAVYTRNRETEEVFHIKLAAAYCKSWSDILNIVRLGVQAEDGSFDIISANLTNAVNQAASGYTLFFDDMPNIDPSAPWWLSRLNDDASIAGRHFLMMGYLNFQIFESTGALFFNKKMIEDAHLTSPYSYVNTGTWTFDVLEEYLAGMSGDLDGDGALTEKDRYGFATNNSTWMQFFVSAGCSSVTKDESDMPQLCVTSEKNVDTLQYITKLLNDPTKVLLAERITGWPYSVGSRNERLWIPTDAFTENRSLFFADLVCNLNSFREMEADFGIIPAPKRDEEQKDYSVYIHPTHATAVQLPKTAEDLNLVSAVTEYMCYASYVHIRPALFETILGSKYIRDSESAVSLDIIFQSARFDLGVVIGLSLDTAMRDLIAYNKPDMLASTLKKSDASNQKTLTAIINKLTQ